MNLFVSQFDVAPCCAPPSPASPASSLRNASPHRPAQSFSRVSSRGMEVPEGCSASSEQAKRTPLQCRRMHPLHTPASSARSTCIFRQGEEACTWIWTRSTRPTSPLPSCLTRRKCDSRRSPSLPTSCRSLFQSGAPCDHTADRKQTCATSPSHALGCNFTLTCCTAAKTGLRVGLQGLGWQLRQYPAALGVSLANLSTGAHLAECWVRQLSPYRPRRLPASHRVRDSSGRDAHSCVRLGGHDAHCDRLPGVGSQANVLQRGVDHACCLLRLPQRHRVHQWDLARRYRIRCRDINLRAAEICVVCCGSECNPCRASMAASQGAASLT